MKTEWPIHQTNFSCVAKNGLETRLPVLARCWLTLVSAAISCYQRMVPWEVPLWLLESLLIRDDQLQPPLNTGSWLTELVLSQRPQVIVPVLRLSHTQGAQVRRKRALCVHRNNTFVTNWCWKMSGSASTHLPSALASSLLLTSVWPGSHLMHIIVYKRARPEIKTYLISNSQDMTPENATEEIATARQ